MNIDFNFAVRLLDLIIDAVLVYLVWGLYKERRDANEDDEED